MLKTENLELNIIEGTDVPNHAVFNENANKIDEFAKNTNEKLTNTSLKIENINNTITNLGEVNNTQNESISSLRTDLGDVENDVMSLNEKNTNLSSRLETVETDVLSLNVKSIKGGTSFHIQNNTSNFSRTEPKLIELSNAVTDNNFKDGKLQVFYSIYEEYPDKKIKLLELKTPEEKKVGLAFLKAILEDTKG